MPRCGRCGHPEYSHRAEADMRGNACRDCGMITPHVCPGYRGLAESEAAAWAAAVDSAGIPAIRTSCAPLARA